MGQCLHQTVLVHRHFMTHQTHLDTHRVPPASDQMPQADWSIPTSSKGSLTRPALLPPCRNPPPPPGKKTILLIDISTCSDILNHQRCSGLSLYSQGALRCRPRKHQKPSVFLPLFGYSSESSSHVRRYDFPQRTARQHQKRTQCPTDRCPNTC